jgi:hypothetical protein
VGRDLSGAMGKKMLVDVDDSMDLFKYVFMYVFMSLIM